MRRSVRLPAFLEKYFYEEKAVTGSFFFIFPHFSSFSFMFRLFFIAEVELPIVQFQRQARETGSLELLLAGNRPGQSGQAQGCRPRTHLTPILDE